MRNLKILSTLSFCCALFMTSCVKDGAVGETIAAQVTGTFMSSSATVTVDNEMLAEAAADYIVRIIEVDANTVSVISQDIPTFEVNLEKNDNGDLTIGKTSSGASGFTFKYFVGDGMLELKYSNDDVTIDYMGVKE